MGGRDRERKRRGWGRGKGRSVLSLATSLVVSFCASAWACPQPPAAPLFSTRTRFLVSSGGLAAVLIGKVGV